MSLNEQLANLQRTGLLTPHTATTDEVQHHIQVASRYLVDAQRVENALESRFSMAYSAGHMLLMAAVKMKGFRTTSDKGHRAVLYQIMDALVPGAAGEKDSLARAHNARNRAEYDGDDLDVTHGQVEDLVTAVKSVREEVQYLFKQFQRQHAEK